MDTKIAVIWAAIFVLKKLRLCHLSHEKTTVLLLVYSIA